MIKKDEMMTGIENFPSISYPDIVNREKERERERERERGRETETETETERQRQRVGPVLFYTEYATRIRHSKTCTVEKAYCLLPGYHSVEYKEVCDIDFSAA